VSESEQAQRVIKSDGSAGPTVELDFQAQTSPDSANDELRAQQQQQQQ
jgi:hypothetical protein